jgi:hypothetical protein
MIIPIIEIKMISNSCPFLRENGFDFTKEIKDGRVKYYGGPYRWPHGF